MTDPVRPVAPLTPLEYVVGYCRQVAADGILPSSDWFAQAVELLEPLLAPVPCAASPADQTWEQRARQHLWLNHGCAFRDGIYGDDGEMQCNNTARHRPLDFKRESWDALSDEIFRAQLARATGEGARDAVYESDSRHADDAALERRQDAAASVDRAPHHGDAAAADTRCVGSAEGQGARDHAGHQPDSPAVALEVAAPVAVSLGLPEALAAFIDVYDVVFDEDDVVMLQAVLARLRGEATVRCGCGNAISREGVLCAECTTEKKESMAAFDPASLEDQPRGEPLDLEAEIAVLHNTCGHYERELAHQKAALSAIRALVQRIAELDRWTPNKFGQMSGWVSGEYLHRDEVLELFAALCPAPPEDQT